MKKQGNCWKSLKAVDKVSRCLSDHFVVCVSDQFPAGHHYNVPHQQSMIKKCDSVALNFKVITQ